MAINGPAPHFLKRGMSSVVLQFKFEARCGYTFLCDQLTSASWGARKFLLQKCRWSHRAAMGRCLSPIHISTFGCGSRLNGDMVVVSRYREIAARSVTVPINLADNEMVPFCGSNHFLPLAGLFWIIQSYGFTGFAEEEAYGSTFIVHTLSSGQFCYANVSWWRNFFKNYKDPCGIWNISYNYFTIACGLANTVG